MATDIPGDTAGTDAAARSPLSLDEFERMKASALFGDEDVAHLRLSSEVVNRACCN